MEYILEKLLALIITGTLLVNKSLDQLEIYCSNEIVFSRVSISAFDLKMNNMGYRHQYMQCTSTI